MITPRSGGGFSPGQGWGILPGQRGAQKEAIEKGRDFCSEQGKVFAVLKEDRSGVVGWSPQESRITFSCTEDTKAISEKLVVDCRADMQSPQLDPIRTKVELTRESSESPVPFAIAANDSFPTKDERPAIAKWAELREVCIKRFESAYVLPPGLTPLQATNTEQLRAVDRAVGARVGDLIVSLYQQKLTYGEFAKKRYEISREGADIQRQLRQSYQIADREQQIRAQQMAQQQFQNNVAAWSTYVQAVNARQPQTVYLKGNCNTVKIGNSVTTNCY